MPPAEDAVWIAKWCPRLAAQGVGTAKYYVFIPTSAGTIVVVPGHRALVVTPPAGWRSRLSSRGDPRAGPRMTSTDSPTSRRRSLWVPRVRAGATDDDGDSPAVATREREVEVVRECRRLVPVLTRECRGSPRASSAGEGIRTAWRSAAVAGAAAPLVS
jgi:hypothetical protein